MPYNKFQNWKIGQRTHLPCSPPAKPCPKNPALARHHLTASRILTLRTLLDTRHVRISGSRSQCQKPIGASPAPRIRIPIITDLSKP